MREGWVGSIEGGSRVHHLKVQGFLKDCWLGPSKWPEHVLGQQVGRRSLFLAPGILTMNTFYVSCLSAPLSLPRNGFWSDGWMHAMSRGFCKVELVELAIEATVFLFERKRE